MLQERRVYLGGPITGLSYGDARHGWREEFARIMDGMGEDYRHIKLSSPMRGKDNLKDLKNIGPSGKQPEYDHFMSQSRSIVCRDRNDVLTSDAVVFNFLGATKASVGSCIEIGWADAFRKPAILVMEKNGIVVTGGGRDNIHNPHEHLMIDGILGYRVDNLVDAAFAVAQLLTPGI